MVRRVHGVVLPPEVNAGRHMIVKSTVPRIARSRGTRSWPGCTSGSPGWRGTMKSTTSPTEPVPRNLVISTLESGMYSCLARAAAAHRTEKLPPRPASSKDANTWRVEPRQAAPVDRPAGVYQRHGMQVTDDIVALDGHGNGQARRLPPDRTLPGTYETTHETTSLTGRRRCRVRGLHQRTIWSASRAGQPCCTRLAT